MVKDIWQLLKGVVDLAAEVGLDDEAFLGLEWPYNYRSITKTEMLIE